MTTEHLKAFSCIVHSLSRAHYLAVVGLRFGTPQEQICSAWEGRLALILL